MYSQSSRNTPNIYSNNLYPGNVTPIYRVTSHVRFSAATTLRAKLLHFGSDTVYVGGSNPFPAVRHGRQFYVEEIRPPGAVCCLEGRRYPSRGYTMPFV